MIVVKDKCRYNWKLEEWEFVCKVCIRKGLPPPYLQWLDAEIIKTNEALHRFGDESTEGKL
jgi:hypothetical protein